MIRAMHLSKDNRLRTDLQTIDVAFALKDEGGLVWVDLQDVPPEESEALLTEVFGFHPLAVKNALREQQSPKIDDWGTHLYLVLHSAVLDQTDTSRLETRELDIFLGKNYLVTLHSRTIPSVETTWESLARDAHQLREGVDHVLYRIADEMAGNYWRMAEQIDESIDRFEAQVFQNPRRVILERLFALKRAVVQLRRIVAPQQEIFNRLARDEFPVVDRKDRVYFRDVSQHMARLFEQIEGERDLVSSAMDTYLSMSNNRLTDVMRTLTLITTTFMPLSFVTSFFGMNFFFPETPITELMERSVLVFVMVLLIGIPVAMLGWMRRRGWLNV